MWYIFSAAAGDDGVLRFFCKMAPLLGEEIVR